MCETNESRKIDDKKADEKEIFNEVNMSNLSTGPKVFLQTLKCKLISDKKEAVVRIVLDTGSQNSYIVKNLAEDMGYAPVKKETLIHSLFGGVKTEEFKHTCYRIRLRSIKNDFACNFEALDQVTICNDVSPVNSGPWLKELKEMDITLSDVGEISQPVQVLIGADIFGKIVTGQRKDLSSGLVALETLLGWTLLGKVPDSEVASSNAMMVTSLLVKEMDISDMWRLDSIGIQDPSEQKTKEELHEATMDHFLKTVKINEDQRFHVCLPWIDTHLPLPSNYNLAVRGLEVTSRKLKNEKLYEAYGEVFEEWEREKIIEEVPKEDMLFPCHYLPHRHVVKENSTTRIRPVFNASSKQKGYPSLNDCVEKGLNLIELIPSMISRFRLFKFGVTADVRKAFLQISLNKQDRDFLRFLWYDKDGELKYYRHCRVVFGVSCSPFLLAATIRYHLEMKLGEATHGNKRYPEDIVRQLSNSFYVDNCLISVKTETELKQFIKVATEIMAERKFDIRGWEFTNPSESIESPTNILGMMWDRQNDTLSISIPDVKEAQNEVISKRNILAAAHRVYDPIGITSPVILRPKLWLQNLWKSKIGWDEEVDSKTRQDFLKWLNELEYLKNLKVPRWLHCEIGLENISLHFFCDASKLAYSTVAFLRVDNGTIVFVQLVQSKTRIAPCGKKETTIARLELLGATISARLYTEIIKEFKTVNVYFWTDSTTVLAWLKREDVWGAFVQNRVQEIRQLTPVDAWRHVPGSSNPADLPSRGCSSQQLCCSKWWEGPSWLYLSPHDWPATDPERDVNEDEVIKEKRKTVVSSMMNIDVEEICCDRYSSYSKNIRVVAWILRFIHNISHGNKLKGNLSSEEFQQAEALFFKSIQSKAFQDKKFLSKMQAFKDEKGLLRIRTKLIESDETDEFKLPILLPACSGIEKLIREEHEKAMHAGSSILLAKLRENFWILRAKKLVKQVLSKCATCQRYKSRPVEVPFAPLPRERITQTKVFEVSGVDYAGPLYLKSKGKAWIVLFTCAVYRAVHFELVESLTTDAYIQALRRFIARRGRVSVLYSDNGTNFMGTNNALKALNWEEIEVFSTARKITWKFIPPTAAWWGGFWERMVRMLKELLRRVLGKSTVNYEELNTILCDCEAVINSRPLTYLQDDPNDLVPLTPDMFIYSGGNSKAPDLDSVDRSSLIKRVKYLQKLRENLRQRFRNEYLALLVHKGIRRSDVLSVGDVVLIGQDNIRRIDWPLGVILEVFPGKDGVPRVAKLRTFKGERIRPFQRIYPLEISARTDVDVLQTAKDTIGEKRTTQSRAGRAVKIPRRLDL